MSLCETRSLFKTELARVISAKWRHLLLLLLTSLNQAPLCTDQSKHQKTISQFKRTWFIPLILLSINSHATFWLKGEEVYWRKRVQ
jgi:hypothetical protein